MSQSASAAASPLLPSHSLILLSTSGCSALPGAGCAVHSSRKRTTPGSDRRKKRCCDVRSSGRAPVSEEYGSMRSVGAYVELQFSHESPFWSFVPHTGHVPLM